MRQKCLVNPQWKRIIINSKKLGQENMEDLQEFNLGPLGESNPRPLAPKARIIPLDQTPINLLDRCEQDLNLRGQSPIDFKSISLTARTSQLLASIESWTRDLMITSHTLYQLSYRGAALPLSVLPVIPPRFELGSDKAAAPISTALRIFCCQHFNEPA